MDLLSIIKIHHSFNDIQKASKLNYKVLKKELDRLRNKYLIFKNYKQEYHILYESKVYKRGLDYFVLVKDQYFQVKYKDLNKAEENDIVKFYLYSFNNLFFADIVHIKKYSDVTFTSIIYQKNNKTFFKYKDKLIYISKTNINLDYLYKVKFDRKEYKVINYEIINKDINTNYLYEIASKYGFYNDYLDDKKYEITKDDLINRTSFIDDYVVTIDGISTLDFDDAYSLTYLNNIYYLNVHIADVSHYVSLNSDLDYKARKKGTSLYIADIVIPMLPKYLSEDICSLQQDKTRLTLSVLMQIDNKGNILTSDFKLGYIKVKRKLTYEEVNRYYNNELTYDDPNLIKLLDNSYKLNQILHNKYLKLGKINFELPEYKFNFLNHKPIDLIKHDTGISEEIIENFMVTTNTVVATFLAKNNIIAIYRFHDLPSTEKLNLFLNSLKPYILINTNNNLNLYQHIISEFSNLDNSSLLNQELLKTMAKARYDVNNKSHFGLGLDYYLHFTSPIRRYPDLITHHILKVYLTNNLLPSLNLSDIALSSTEQEKLGIECEREVFELHTAIYLQDKISESFTAIVSSILSFGFFVFVDGIEGLVSINSLCDPYYNEINNTIKSRNRYYKLGDEVEVVLYNVNIEKRNIDFVVKGDFNDFFY